MKRFISLLSLALILVSNGMITVNAASTYTGIAKSNALADYIAYSSATGYFFEKTADGNDSGLNDVRIGNNAGESVYLGSDEKFDGLSVDVGTVATGGKYIVEYWDGSNWSTLVSESSDAIKNDSSSGVLALSWDRPSTWAKKTLAINFNEEASTAETSSSLYFVRIRLTAGYSTNAYADQFGLLNYNAIFDVKTQLGSSLTLTSSNVSFSSSTGDTTIYASKALSNGTYAYALYTPSSTSYTYTLNVSGYVQESANTTLSEVPTTISESLNYAQVLIARDPKTSNEVSIDTATAGTANTTCVISSKHAYCPVPAAQDGANATIYADGYAPTSAALYNRSLDTDSQASNYLTLNYAYIATVKDEDGNYVNNASVEMGDSSYEIDCNYISSGQYGCVVPKSNYLGKIRISGSSFDTETSSFSTPRNSNSDSQVNQTFTLGSIDCGSSCSNNEVDLDVVSMDWESDGDFVFNLKNKGDEDVKSSEKVYVSVYVDGDREYYEYFSNESGNDFLDAGEDDTFNLGDNFFDDENESYEVEVCVDATDTVDESSESNNCMTEDLEMGSNSSDGVDLEVEDMYTDDNDLVIEVANNGDEDVSSKDSVKIYIYVDGDLEYTLVVDDKDNESDFFNNGDSSKITIGDKIFDGHGNSYDVKACVDVGDSVDESDEDNNCRTEDDNELDKGSNNNNNTCEDFRDIDGHWGEDYICDLFDLDVVEGYSPYSYKPNDDVSRAEFLKMALLAFDKNVGNTSGVHYSDVSSSAWYYDYITYATDKDYVEGYSNGSFRPNDDISRAEALVILLRIANQDDTEGDNISSNDINFYDVSRHDWFAWAVVVADDDNLVKGYGDGTFGPDNDLSRAEAAKIIDLAIQKY